MKRIPGELLSIVNAFLEKPLIARMATAAQNGQPHVVPVWYGWDGKALWISSFVSTRKYAEMQHNPLISVVIDTVEKNGDIKFVILEGTAELIEEPREFIARQSIWIYKRYLGEEGVLASDPQSWSIDPENRIIKLLPDQIYLRGF